MVEKLVLILAFLFLNFIQSFAQGWFHQNSNTNSSLLSVYFITENYGFAVGYDDVILKTTDGGSNWMVTHSGITNFHRQVYFLDSLTGFITGTKYLLKTTDGGNTWFIQDSTDNKPTYYIEFLDKDTGFVAGPEILLKTTNGGNSWTKHDFYTGGFHCFQPLNSKEFVVGAQGPLIIKSYDGGATWSNRIWYGGTVVVRDMYFTSEEKGFALTSAFAQGISSGAIFHTENRGEDWNSIGSFPPLYALDFPNADIGYIVGAYGTVFKTVDGGFSWSEQLTGLSIDYNPYSVHFPSVKTGYSVGYNGMIAKTTTGGETPGFIPGEDIFSKAYPNPVTDKLTIETDQFSSYTIELYDLSGKLILKDHLENNYREIFTYGLRSGTYILKIYSDSATEIHKLIKI